MSEQVELKRKLISAIENAEKLAYEYFRNCELGSERKAAGQVYENLRAAAKVK